MILRKAVVLFAVLSPLAAFAQGCQSGGVGDPCTPEDEYQNTFSGFSATELNIESRSFQCETRVCLVNHFRGRVSCPLGMGETTLAGLKAGTIKPDDPKVCRIPGSSGAKAETIQVAVQPQCNAALPSAGARRAENSVYCSCRCDGPDANAKYCSCPGGYTCKKFTEFDVGAAVSGGSSQLRGSYCVKEKTDYIEGSCISKNTADQTILDDDACKDDGKCGVKVNPLASLSRRGQEAPPAARESVSAMLRRTSQRTTCERMGSR